MINSIIESSREKERKFIQTAPQQTQPSKISPSPLTIFKLDEFLLISIINIILLTVQLTIFNICFLIVFITSSLKFYKTYIIQKHVDQIQIPAISTKTKSSILVYYFSKVAHILLTDRTLVNNLLYIGGVSGAYFVVESLPFFVLLILIVDVEYAYCLGKRWKQGKKENNQTLPEKQLSSPKHTLSDNSYNIDSESSLLYFSSTMKPIKSTFSQIQSSETNDLSQKSTQSRSRITKKFMRTIEEEEHDKALDGQLPQISTINILHPRNSAKKF